MPRITREIVKDVVTAVSQRAGVTPLELGQAVDIEALRWFRDLAVALCLDAAPGVQGAALAQSFSVGEDDLERMNQRALRRIGTDLSQTFRAWLKQLCRSARVNVPKPPVRPWGGDVEAEVDRVFEMVAEQATAYFESRGASASSQYSGEDLKRSLALQPCALREFAWLAVDLCARSLVVSRTALALYLNVPLPNLTRRREQLPVLMAERPWLRVVDRKFSDELDIYPRE